MGEKKVVFPPSVPSLGVSAHSETRLGRSVSVRPPRVYKDTVLLSGGFDSGENRKKEKETERFFSSLASISHTQLPPFHYLLL